MKYVIQNTADHGTFRKPELDKILPVDRQILHRKRNIVTYQAFTDRFYCLQLSDPGPPQRGVCRDIGSLKYGEPLDKVMRMLGHELMDRFPGRLHKLIVKEYEF